MISINQFHLMGTFLRWAERVMRLNLCTMVFKGAFIVTISEKSMMTFCTHHIEVLWEICHDSNHLDLLQFVYHHNKSTADSLTGSPLFWTIWILGTNMSGYFSLTTAQRSTKLSTSNSPPSSVTLEPLYLALQMDPWLPHRQIAISADQWQHLLTDHQQRSTSALYAESPALLSLHL